MPQPVKFAVLLLLIAFPLLEIGLLIRAGQILGFWPLAAIVFATAMAGAAVIRRIGVKMLQKLLSEMEAGRFGRQVSGRGRAGLDLMLDGLLQGAAGVLLILPGFISDALGVALLIPALRRYVIRSGFAKLVAGAAARAEVFESVFETRRAHHPPEPPPGPGPVIEGEYERIDDDHDQNRPRPPRAPAR